MKKTMRVLLFVLSAVFAVFFFILLTQFTSIPGLTKGLAGALQTGRGLAVACALFLVVCLVLSLAVCVFVCLFPSSKNFYTIKKEKGNIQISKKGIAALAGIPIHKMPEIKRYHVQAKSLGAGSKLNLVIRIETNAAENMVAAGEKIQTEVSESLQAMFNVDAEQIHIQIFPFEPLSADTKEKRDLQ